jgi:Abnormal spindle-like microcephaly-assoc'd, ASPM-SPD-2-Hydin
MKYLLNLRAALGLFLILMSASVFAVGDATLGQPLFEGKTKPGMGCLGAGCHGATAFQNTNKICNGTTTAGILVGFNNVAEMAALKTFYGLNLLTSVDVDNIAAYIAAQCGPPAAPAATLTPATGLAFGSVQQGATSAALVGTLKNTGTATLSIATISITGTNATDFTKGTTTCGAMLAAAASCTVNVTFTPGAVGARSASLSFADNATGSPHTLALTGTGTAPATPGVSLTPSPLAFSDQQINTTSATQVITLKNTGTGILNIGGITSSSADFVQTNPCGASLGAGLSCAISVNFKPTTLGAKTGTISVADNATGSPHIVLLSGNGVAAPAPAITLTPNTGLAFGNVTVGSPSAAQTVTLKNTGTANLVLTTVTVGGANAVDFAKSGTCANGGTVAANATCTIAVTFTPSAAGARTGSVAITSNAPTSNIALSGTGTAVAMPQISLTPTSLAFGNQTINTTSVAKAITLTNSGNASLAISNIAASGEFAQSNNCGVSLAMGLSCTINVTLTPTTVASKTGSITITDNATGSPHAIALTGSGVAAAAPVVGPLPASLSFGNVQINTASAVQSVTVSNTGNAALVLSTIAVSGDYAKSGGTCANGGSVAAAANCTILVTFKPTVAGARTGTLTITDNASGSPRSVALSGTGTTAPLPTATLLPAKLSFGNQTINSTSAAQLATLKNTSVSAVLNISSITISGTNSADFTKATSTCGTTLAAGVSCTISVTFKPTVAALRTASLNVASDSGALATVLEGTGVAVATPDVSLTPTALAFGDQSIGVASAAKIVSLSNSGNATLHITSIAASGDFAQTNACGTQVNAGASCDISITFKPTVAGARSGTVTIVSDALVSTDTITLSGAGAATAPLLSVSVASLDFGAQVIGATSSPQAITLRNIGNGAMQVKAILIAGTNASDFSQTNGCATSLAAGATCAVNVVFKPTVAGTRSAKVDISTNAGDGSDSVTLTGTASGGTPILSIPSVSLEFETTKAGQISAQLEITLKNTGTADLKLGKIAVKQGDSFSVVTNSCGVILAPNQACSIKVAFKPKTAGEHIDHLEVANDTDGTTQLVELKGQAAAADTGGTPTTNSGGGGGCVMSTHGTFDIALLTLFLFSGLGLVLRKREKE